MATAFVNDPVLTITPDHIAAIERAVTAMRAEPDYAFNLDTLAEIASFSSFHFARLFRRLIGIPPGEFLTALRYERSKELLLQSDLSITDICFEVGYDSLGTFSSRFKRLVGIGPATFRALPDVLDTLEFADRLEQPAPRDFATKASIRGHYMNAGELSGTWRAYVGLFPASIARSRPVAGMRLDPNDEFVIPAVPKGDYRMLSAAVSLNSSAFSRLLPDTAMRVATFPDTITVTTGDEIIETPLAFRTLTPNDPPILIALPALDFPFINTASAITRDALQHISPWLAIDASQAARS